MIYVVLFFTFFSLFLYVLLGGADFGAGIVELFSSKEDKRTTRDIAYSVMGPVWEANHIWLIILIVVLWIAFPAYFNVIVIYLHIPFVLILLGITTRGVAFIFRHYDAIVDESQFTYNWLFRISSFVTPVFLGMAFGALIGGEIILTDNYSDYSFYEIFMQPWLNVFTFLVGLFYAALCAFMASTLLIAETSGDVKKMFSRKSAAYNIWLVVLGLVLILYGYFTGVKFIQDFIHNPVSLGAIALSALLLIPLWRSIRKQNKIWSRYLAGIQVVLVLFAAIYAHFPYIIITTDQELNLVADRAPDEVIQNLAIMLLIGGFVVLPGLFHLMRSFGMIKILDHGSEEMEQQQ